MTSRMFGKSESATFIYTHKSLQHAGVWPRRAEPCSVLLSTLQGKRRSLELITWQQQALELFQPPQQPLELSHRTSMFCCHCPQIQEKCEKTPSCLAIENKEGKEGMGGRDTTGAEHHSLSLGELQDIQKDFSYHPSGVTTWLLRCSDVWASSLELECREDKQLGSLPRKAGIDRIIGEVTQVLNLWSWSYQSWGKGFPPRKISRVAQENGLHRQRYPITRGVSPLRDDLLWPEKHTATDPDEVQSMWSMWQKFVWHTPLSHSNPLATLVWRESAAATVDEAVHQLEEYECMTVFLPPSSQL